MTLPTMNTRWARALLLPLLALALGGCWDHIELNRRAFVIGVGIDLPATTEMGREPAAGEQNRPAAYRMATEIVLWQGSGQGSAGGSSFVPPLTKPARTLTGAGPSLFSIEAVLNSRTSRQLYWSHLKTIFVGESFAREVGLKPIVDFFTRDYEFNRRMRIGITQGEALAFIETTAIGDEFVGEHAASMFEHAPLSVRSPEGNFNHFDAIMRGGGNMLLPRLTLGEGEIKIGGSAVIKHGKMVGWLGEMETIWAVSVFNELQGGTIVVADPADPAGEVVFVIDHARTDKTMEQNSDRLGFKLDVQVEGRIMERVVFDASSLDTQWIGKVEKAVAQTIENGIKEVLHQAQHTYEADIFGFDDHVQKRKPKLWERLKDNWDDQGFQALAFTVTASVSMKRHGATR